MWQNDPNKWKVLGRLWGSELLCPATLFVGMDNQGCASTSKDDPEVPPILLCLQTPSDQQTSRQEWAAHTRSSNRVRSQVPSASAQIKKCVKSTIECYSSFPAKDILTCTTACSNFEDATWHLPRTGVISFYLCSILTDAKFTRRKAKKSLRKKWDIKQTEFL